MFQFSLQILMTPITVQLIDLSKFICLFFKGFSACKFLLIIVL